MIFLKQAYASAVATAETELMDKWFADMQLDAATMVAAWNTPSHAHVVFNACEELMNLVADRKKMSEQRQFDAMIDELMALCEVR